MADINKTIEIIFGAQDKNTQSTINSITSSLSALDAGVHSVTGPIADISKSMLKAEAAIIATGIAVTALSVNMAGEFTTSIAEVGTLMNLNAEQNNALAQTLLNYSRDATVGLNDIVAASYIAISTGTQLTDVTTQLAAAEQLAVAGATDLTTATGALSRTMNAYGFEAEEADRVSNALFITVQNGDTTMSLLASTIGRVASIAANSNVPLETLLAAIAAITVAGIKTTESITGMSALFKELAKPTAELSAALGGMNLSTNSLEEIMAKLKEATGGSFVEMTNLFGSIEATNVAVVLANDATGTFVNTLVAMETETKALEQAYGIMEGTFTRVNQNLVNNIKATLIDAGIPLLEEYGSAVKAISSIFQALGEGLDAPNFDKVYAAIQSFVSNFTVLLEGIATALPDALALVDFSGIIASFGELTDTVGNVFESLFGEGLDLTKPEDLALVLQKVVNGITAMTQVTDQIIQDFGPIFDAIGRLISDIAGIDEGTARTAGNIAANALAIEGFGIVMGTALIYVRETKADIQDVFNVITGGVGTLTNALQVAFDAYIVLIARSVSVIFDVLGNLPDFLGGDAFQKEADEFALIGDAAAENLARNFSEMLQSAEKFNSGVQGEMGLAARSIESIGGSGDKSAQQLSESSKIIVGSLEDISIRAGIAGQSVGEYILAIAGVAAGTADAAKVTSEMAEATGDVAQSFREIENEADAADGSMDGFIRTVENGVTIWEQTQESLAKVSKEVTQSGEAAKAAEIDFTELEKTMLELASNEKIANMEFTAELKIAQINAQKEQIIAAFESISTVVTALAGNVTDLWSIFAGEGLDLRTKWTIEDAAERAEDRLEKQLELQEKLTAAQIELMSAQAKALVEDTIVRISADGLAPELEAFMFEILDRIQVSVQGSKEAFLLAAGT